VNARWRGLVSLAIEGVEHGSRAIERVHLATARRTFAILEAIPTTAAVSKVVHVVHDATVKASYTAVRIGGKIAGAVVMGAMAEGEA
jgi:hypothetical protein